MFLVANIVDAVAVVCHMLINGYMLVVLAACVLSWFRLSPYSPLVRVLRQLTDPVFALVRRHLPFTCTGGLDFSPVAVIIVLELFDLIVIRSARQLALAL